MTRRDIVISGAGVVSLVVLAYLFDFEHGVRRFLFLATATGAAEFFLLGYLNRDATPRWMGILARPLWQRLVLFGMTMPLFWLIIRLPDWSRHGDWIPSIAGFTGAAVAGVLWVIWQEVRSQPPQSAKGQRHG